MFLLKNFGFLYSKTHNFIHIHLFTKQNLYSTLCVLYLCVSSRWLRYACPRSDYRCCQLSLNLFWSQLRHTCFWILHNRNISNISPFFKTCLQWFICRLVPETTNEKIPRMFRFFWLFFSSYPLGGGGNTILILTTIHNTNEFTHPTLWHVRDKQQNSSLTLWKPHHVFSSSLLKCDSESITTLQNIRNHSPNDTETTSQKTCSFCNTALRTSNPKAHSNPGSIWEWYHKNTLMEAVYHLYADIIKRVLFFQMTQWTLLCATLWTWRCHLTKKTSWY